MLCTRCRAQAVVALPSHTAAFCADCFLEFFRRQTERGIASQHLLETNDSILVALSGGKDSLALMLVLGDLGYKVTGLHIDLGIPESSPAARRAVENFCRQHDFPLIMVDMNAEGLPLPLVKSRLRRPICSVCGKIKRHYFNKIARERGFTTLATGHNLDDEVSRLFGNVLRWDTAYLADQGPLLNGTNGFVKKVKPLWRLTEFEIANYAFLRGIENHYAPCPYSQGATFAFHKRLLYELENAMPGRKINFYQGFLERGRPTFSRLEQEQPPHLHPCTRCGYPTNQEICSVCRIRAMLHIDPGQGLKQA